MEKLWVRKVISEKHDYVYIESPREMAPVYTLPGTERRYIDRRFSKHHLTMYVDDPNLIKAEGEKYDVVYTSDYLLGDVEVACVIEEKEKGCYLVILKADKVAILQTKLKIERERD